jgi:MoxR-like ATPase
MPYGLSNDAPFQPTFSAPMVSSLLTPQEQEQAAGGDRRDGRVYVYTQRIIVAVNVAIVTDRPLLLRGPSGSGKSSMARNVAHALGWRYYEQVISSRTEARDLLWRFDTIRRLSDAHITRGVLPDVEYIEPGILWWAFDRAGARRRGLPPNRKPTVEPIEPPGDRRDHLRAVILLDEIDKADPDVPNNLLVPLGSHEFELPELEEPLIKAQERPLVMLTTNDERELPAAFLRRCIILELPRPASKQLVDIATAHFGSAHTPLFRKVAKLMEAGTPANSSDAELPSTAEYLDVVSACLKLKVQPGNAIWQELVKVALFKPRGAAGAA